MLRTEWWERRLPWAAAAAAVSAAFMAWWLHWFDLVDLEVYRAGATAFLHGHDVYLAHPRIIPLPFTYPPFAAVFFVPFGVLPDTLSRVVMSLLSGAALVVAALAALRLAACTWPSRARWTVALGIAAATPLVEPLRDTFRLGQVNLVLMALVLADLAAIVATDATATEGRAGATEGRPGQRRPGATEGRPGQRRAGATEGRPGQLRPGQWRPGQWRPGQWRPGQWRPGRLPLGVPAGMLIGVATAVKLTPGIFILYLLVIRRTREGVTAMVAAAAATALAWLLMPSESAHYWRHLVLDDRRIGSPGSVWNQSLRGALARLTGSPTAAHALWLVLAVTVLAVGVALAARLDGDGERLLGVGVAALTGLLVSPISWNHHWVWALPLAIGLVSRAVATRRRLDWWIAAGWAATFCLASVSWWPFAHQDNYHLGVLYGAAADCYVLAALVVGGLIAWRAWWAPAARRPTEVAR